MSLIDDHRNSLQASYAVAAPPLASAVQCRFCGSVPAVDATFRGHIGMVLMMRILSQEGPFCRDCGIYTYRKITANTLVQGWWGLASSFITPCILVLNSFPRWKVGRLSAPQWPAAGRRPADVGRPIYLRWQILGLLVPVIVAAIIVAAIVAPSSPAATSDDPGTGAVGSCVTVSSDGTGYIGGIVDCSQQHQGRVTKVVYDDADCPDDTTWSWSTGDGVVLCVATNFN